MPPKKNNQGNKPRKRRGRPPLPKNLRKSKKKHPWDSGSSEDEAEQNLGYENYPNYFDDARSNSNSDDVSDEEGVAKKNPTTSVIDGLEAEIEEDDVELVEEIGENSSEISSLSTSMINFFETFRSNPKFTFEKKTFHNYFW